MPQLNNTLIDNSDNLKLTDFLLQCFSSSDLEEVSIATGYWDLPGLALLKDALRKFLSQPNSRLRLMIGRDPMVYASQLKQAKYKDDNSMADYIRTDLNELEVTEEYQDAVDLLLEYCTGDNPKMEVRHYEKDSEGNSQFLHSKCYIFKGKEERFGYGIVGSSNFTKKGLEDNAELNYLETQKLIVLSPERLGDTKSHIVWFNEKWDVAESWNQIFLEQLLNSPVGKEVDENRKKNQQTAAPFTPYEAYIKMLQLKFDEVVDLDMREQLLGYLPKTADGETPIYTPFDFQLEAVQWCYSIMKMHGGFMLGDVVGVGKTLTATMLIKYFVENCDINVRSNKVLIVVPPAIKAGWETTIANFDTNAEHPLAPNITYVTTGSIDKLMEIEDVDPDDAPDDNANADTLDGNEFTIDLSKIPVEDFGLVVIDESHRFRRRTTQMYKSMTMLIDGIYNRRGYYPYVGLLSATLQNNYPQDLQNQLYLFEHTPKLSTLEKVEGCDLDSFFGRLNKDYREVMQAQPANEEERKKNRKRLENIASDIRNKILVDVLVRRTRKDIARYTQALQFPVVRGPEKLEYKMNNNLAKLFADTLDILMPYDGFQFDSDSGLCYYRYRATEHLTPDLQKRYTTRSVNPENTAIRLASIMQNLLIKRLECSFGAFVESLENFKKSCENMIQMWKDDCIFICPDMQVNAELDTEKHNRSRSECYAALRKKISEKNLQGKNERFQNAEYCRQDFKDSYVDLVKRDLDLVDKLLYRWLKNQSDPKMDKFKEVLNTELFGGKRNSSQKLVIFTEAIPTAKQLEEVVTDKGHRPLVVTAENRKEMEQRIRQNFDANYRGEQRSDYDVIITTDVLAEGINLHRANVILNFDTPWNATRLMQRIGRVNRIGSTEKTVWVYNFYPSAEGDMTIGLVRNAYTKLQAFHILFGEDNKIFSDDEKVAAAGYEHLIEGEESPYQQYINQLSDYKALNPERYNQILQASEVSAARSAAQAKNLFAICEDGRQGTLYVEVDNNGVGRVMSSCIEAYECAKCEPDTQPALPMANKDLQRQVALQTWRNHIDKLSKPRASTSDVQQSCAIIDLWLQRFELQKAEKKTLSLAATLIKAGNSALMKLIADIETDRLAKEQSTAPYTAEQIAQIINAKLIFLGNIHSSAHHAQPCVAAAVYQIQSSYE